MTTNTTPRWMVRIIDIAIALVAIGSIAASTIIVFSDAELTVPLEYTPDADSYTITRAEWGDGTILSSVGAARFEDRTPALVLASVGTIAVYAIGAVVILLLMRAIVASISRGHPFVAPNVARMRWIGITVIVFGILVQAVNSAIALFLMDGVSADGVHIEANLSPNLAVVFTGFVVIALAEAFRHGAVLQAEADLTV